MRHHEQLSEWMGLVVDQRVSPRPLSDADYRAWLGDQRVFISSTMDAELTPYREAIRGYLDDHGGEAVMWETLAPRDENPEGAYLKGVERSTACLIMAGESYGVQDRDGYSPTHREVERAGELFIPRLLIELDSPKRDGHMTRMVKSLYPVVSGIRAASVDEAVRAADQALRQMAAEAHYLWMKLGPFVFLGSVAASGSRGGRSFTVTAEVSANDVRRGLMDLSDGHAGETHLTWPDECCFVEVESTRAVAAHHGDQAVEIICKRRELNQGGMSFTVNNMTEAQRAEAWARQTWLGEEPPRRDSRADIMSAFLGMGAGDGPTLSDVLKTNGVGNWQVAGIARLLLVETLAHTWGGFFRQLRVGPATDRGVPIKGVVELPASASNVPAEFFEIEGVVPRR